MSVHVYVYVYAVWVDECVGMYTAYSNMQKSAHMCIYIYTYVLAQCLCMFTKEFVFVRMYVCMYVCSMYAGM